MDNNKYQFTGEGFKRLERDIELLALSEMIEDAKEDLMEEEIKEIDGLLEILLNSRDDIQVHFTLKRIIAIMNTAQLRELDNISKLINSLEEKK